MNYKKVTVGRALILLMLTSSVYAINSNDLTTQSKVIEQSKSNAIPSVSSTKEGQPVTKEINTNDTAINPVHAQSQNISNSSGVSGTDDANNLKEIGVSL